MSSEQGCIVNGNEHLGIDVQDNYDYPLYSLANGTVSDVGGGENDLRGYFIEICYQSPTGGYEYARYLHLKYNVSNTFSQRDTVSKGQQIGITGGSGGYAVHLHLDIHTGTKKGGTLINPTKYYANTLTY